eukprot:1293137-Pleurochrysis_carterae.AAC.2
MTEILRISCSKHKERVHLKCVDINNANHCGVQAKKEYAGDKPILESQDVLTAAICVVNRKLHQHPVVEDTRAWAYLTARAIRLILFFKLWRCPEESCRTR